MIILDLSRGLKKAPWASVNTTKLCLVVATASADYVRVLHSLSTPRIHLLTSLLPAEYSMEWSIVKYSSPMLKFRIPAVCRFSLLQWVTILD